MNGLKVTVVGGGIGGTAAALALLRAGCDVHVYEQVVNKTEVGAGIQLSPNATRLLHRYGLADALRNRAVRPLGIEIRRWDDGRILGREDLGDAAENAYGAPYYHFHRADLLSVLTAALPAERLHGGRRCIDVSQTATGARAVFDDGSVIDSDVVVGADGIHSAVRKSLFGDERPRFSGNVAYRGLAPVERLAHLNLKHQTTNWMGPGGHFVHYFVSGGRYMNFVAVTEQDNWDRESWNDRGDIAEAKRYYSGWHPQVHEILGAVDETFKWALFDRTPLASWSVGRVTLLGDACHPMLPYLAQGAAQSIEDGATLARCLTDIASSDVERALVTYETWRKPRTAAIQLAARGNSTSFHLPDGAEQQKRDAQMAAWSGLSPRRASIFGFDAERLETAEFV
ncbi:FAD-dependent monooxygenase [Bradyrhizobium prioriisuperbiae]|uniref:FAD-dependent monooxygenase n=1 Tax=Bradyrhizobium prioriisuperbiae TaxID=2854389 RepID=UPI0028EC6061|nr:FAD-dependent monooxygenase [Bradyrhizobium prioritasuperba]